MECEGQELRNDFAVFNYVIIMSDRAVDRLFKTRRAFRLEFKLVPKFMSKTQQKI